MQEFTRLLGEMARRRSESSEGAADEGLEAFRGDAVQAQQKSVEAGHGDQGVMTGMEDYSAFLNFTGETDPITHAPSAPFSSPALNTPFLPTSTTSTLLSSFDEPSTAQTQLLTDFDADGSPDAFAALEPFAPFGAGDAEVFAAAFHGQAAAQKQVGTGAYGCEPAFEDVDFSTLDAHGVFGLSLFGGIPSLDRAKSPAAAPASLPTETAPPALLSDAQMSDLIAAAESLGERTASTRTSPVMQQVHALTASPADVFACMPTPATEVVDAFPQAPAQQSMGARAPVEVEAPVPAPPAPSRSLSTSSATSGKAPSAPGPRKRKSKPYEPTGVRSSRPLLDAGAPTQVKNYLAPGSTTRKLIPVGFQKKLGLAEGADVDAEVLDEIEEKRRKNCLAARESRKRKMDYLNGLRGRIAEWEAWAQSIEELAGQAGLQLPPMPTMDEIVE